MLRQQGIDPAECIAVGDGYSDIPLLDKAGLPILVDRTGEKRKKYASRGYAFAADIPEAAAIIRRAMPGSMINRIE